MLEPLSLLNLLITICLTIGGFMAYRHGFTNTVNEVQERVIHALQSEIQALQDRITIVERENKHLSQAITAICSALEQLGIHVTLDGDFVNIHHHTPDGIHSTNSIYTTHIYAEDELEAGEHSNTPRSHPTTKIPRRRSRSTQLRKEG